MIFVQGLTLNSNNYSSVFGVNISLSNSQKIKLWWNKSKVFAKIYISLISDFKRSNEDQIAIETRQQEANTTRYKMRMWVYFGILYNLHNFL